MKIPSLLLLLSLVVPLAAEEPTPQVRAEQFYRQGVAALKTGNVQSARTAFQNALKLDPKHPHARYQLQELQRNGGQVAAKGRERRLAAVVLPDVRFEDSSLTEVLEGLDFLVRKHSTDQFSPNFIIQDPQKQFEKRLVSVQLKNVPANAVLKYVLEQVGGSAKFDEHAIVVRPMPKAVE